MGLVYIYLATWILGGVLLGSSMLLAQPKEANVLEVLAPLDDTGPSARESHMYPAALALIGFGLTGLGAEGLELVSNTWTWSLALAGALVLGAIGLITRCRSPKQG